MPRASRTTIQGLAAEADGSVVIKVAVTAVPEGGKAIAAVIKLLAKAWDVPKSAISIASGATDRRKLLHVGGPPDDLMRRLDQWIAGLHPAD